MFNKFSISGVNALPRFPLNNEIDHPNHIVPNSDSVSLYIHIPYCKSICQFCMLRRGAKAVDKVPDDYIGWLLKEIELKSVNIKDTEIRSLYFGGGTPSMLSINQIETIIAKFYQLYNISDSVEISFEGEPQSLKTKSYLKSLKSLNISRISFGVQTLDENIRLLLGRTDTLDDIYETIMNINEVGFSELNIDYIYNLPSISTRQIIDEISHLVDLNVNSIDCHPLKYISVSTFMLKEIFNRRLKTPTGEERIEQFSSIRKFLLGNKFFEQYVDQYSIIPRNKSNFYMQNLYGLNGGEYIGFGPGARSHFGDFGSTNYQSLENYSSSILDKKWPVERIVIAPLSDNFITCFPKRNDVLLISDVTNSSDSEYFNNKLTQLLTNGYLNYNHKHYTLTQLGLSWYQNIQEFLLSPIQSQYHSENALVRAKKFDKFDGYFDNIGGILKL